MPERDVPTGMEPPASIRVVILDDHTIVRQGLRSVLELEADIEVVDDVGTPNEALDAVEEHQPDVMLLDLKLGDDRQAEGLDVCTEIVRHHPEVGVVILTTFHDQSMVRDALRRGARGYVLKDVDAADLLKIVRAVHRGESGFDTRSAALVVRSLAGEPPPDTNLTEREIEMVRLLARGLTNREIGQTSFISESTVKFHLRNIMAKLKVHRRAEVVFAASKRGLL